MDNELLDFWIDKYSPQITNYITMVVEFEEMTPEALEKRRRQLLLEYLDTSDSTILIYLMDKFPNFLDRLYEAIYKPFTNGEEIINDANA